MPRKTKNNPAYTEGCYFYISPDNKLRAVTLAQLLGEETLSNFINHCIERELEAWKDSIDTFLAKRRELSERREMTAVRDIREAKLARLSTHIGKAIDALPPAPADQVPCCEAAPEALPEQESA